MSQRSKRLTNRARWLVAVAVLAAIVPATTARAVPVVQPPYDDDYVLVDLGEAPGVHAPYGGLTFVPDDPDAIVLTGFSGAEIAKLFAVALTRDATGSISGFAGSGIELASAFGAGGGTAYGPGGVLFYTRVTGQMGEVKPGSSVTDKVVSLASLYWRPSGLNFVPPGLDGAGALKVVTFSYGEWWSLAIAPDANGTYDVTGAVKGPMLQGHPTGFAYVAPGTPGPLSAGLLVCEGELSYGAGKVVMYDVDGQGNPIVATRRVVVSGLDVPEGIALDPLTGDVLFVGYQGRLYLLRSAPFPPTTTTSTSTSSSTSTSTTTTRPTTTSTSSSTSSSTSTSTTTTRPTTTSTSSSTSTSTRPSTTTIRPTTTSTSSTTTRPSTTSTSSSTSTRPSTTTIRPITTSSTTTSTRAPTSSSTTTTLPPACGLDPSFEWIGCRVDALLTVVRASAGLGSFQATFIAKLEQAQATLAEGAAACAGGEPVLARRALDRLGRQMLLLRARTRTLRARKTIPRPLAQRIGDEARGIAADARALRSALDCA